MKKFTKIMLILAGIFATIGLTCIILAFGMGFTKHDLWKMVRDGRFTFNEDDLKISFDTDWDMDWDEEITSTESKDGETEVYEVESTCNKLDIEFGAGILEIYYDDVETIQVKKNDISNLKVAMKNDTLKIGEGSNISINLGVVEDRKLVLVIPNGMKFEKVEMEIGASKADVKDIIAKKVDISVGAGQAEISNLVAEKFELEVGAGQVNVYLNGVQEDYNYEIDCGIGNVKIGNHSYAGIGAQENVKNEGATKNIDVECGIGEVIIEFKDMFEEL